MELGGGKWSDRSEEDAEDVNKEHGASDKEDVAAFVSLRVDHTELWSHTRDLMKALSHIQCWINIYRKGAFSTGCDLSETIMCPFLKGWGKEWPPFDLF